MPVRMTCPACGSAEIASTNCCDARWDVAVQEWITIDPGCFICDECGEDFDAPREVEIKKDES